MIEQIRQLSPVTIEYIGTLVLLGWIFFIVFLERAFPYTKGLKFFRKGFWTDLVWYTFIQSYYLKIIIFDFIILPIKKQTLPNGLDWFNNQSLLFLILFFLITHDLYIYLFHRFQHTNSFFWRTHEAHHSGKECDWLTGSRSHLIEIIINQTIEFLPIFILLDVEVAIRIVPIKALLDAIFGLWIHANTRVDIGFFKYIINSPLMHQWHHSNHKEVFYANYATKFSLFDFLFNTAYLPKDKETKPILYGLPYHFPNDYFFQTSFSIYRFSITSDFVKTLDNLSERLRMKFVKNTILYFFNTSVADYLFDNNNVKYHTQICIKCGNNLRINCEERIISKQCDTCTGYKLRNERK